MTQELLRRAIELAELGWGGVQPNPLVGAVVADADGNVLGEGFHARHGGPHAELVALAAAGTNAHGATLYVSLEPCRHHGRTPPCTDAIIRSGIARVVYGAADPNPDAGGGAALLREYGIETSGPHEVDRVRRQNAIFFHAHEQRRVFVALKLACSLDGRIAGTRGRATDITETQARAEMHRLRAGFDAIMVGSGTAAADDPLLTARGSVTPVRPPIRILLDSDAALSPASRLVATVSTAPVWLFCAPDAPAERRSALAARGVRIWAAPRAHGGLDLSAVLDTLWHNGVRSVFCEGGARLAGSLARLQRIDRFYLFLAPMLLGPDAVNAFDALPSALPLELVGVQRFGPDVLLTYDRAEVRDSRHAIATSLEGMFTGLVERIGRVISTRDLQQAREFTIAVPEWFGELTEGDSINIDGICLTVVTLTDDGFGVQAVEPTLNRSTAGEWDLGRLVNLERALRAGDRMGGHIVQGHVDGTGEVLSIEPSGEQVILDLVLPAVVAEVTVLHGSITVDGVSLTVSELAEEDVARIALIPHTWSQTNLSRLVTGARVNLEGDLIGRYVVSYLKRWALPALG